MPTQEVRLALVLNGGVSLAVWMAGVVHELDLLRRASSPDGVAPQPYDEDLSAEWARLCGDRRVVVDVIAGASAGGLNGTMLATAIAHRGTLDPTDDEPGPWLKQRWSAIGGLEAGKLIPAPGRTDGPGSVLDGVYFADELEAILQKLASAGTGEDPVTLFVTASGLGEQRFEAKDAAGSSFYVDDHRFLYRFSSVPRLEYRADGTFGPGRHGDGFDEVDALTRAGRASASFPGAFDPVSETQGLVDDNGQLPAGAPDGRPRAWLMDGGVLDNAPFGPVLDVVARQKVADQVERYVLYVVPSSGLGQATTQVSDQQRPGWRTTITSALQYPREADFRNDVDELGRLLRDADASWSDKQRLYDRTVRDGAGAGADLRVAAEALLPIYRRSRAAGGVWEAEVTSSGSRTTVLDAGSVISEQDVDRILDGSPTWVPATGQELVLTVPGSTGDLLWPWGTGPAEQVVTLVMRRCRGALAVAARRRSDPGADADADTERLARTLEATSRVRERVVAIRDAVVDGLRQLDLGGLNPAAVTAKINRLFERLQVQQALGQEMADLQRLVGPDDVLTAVAVEVVSRCTSARTPPQRSAPFHFVRVGPDVGLPLLGPEAARAAHELGDRILYGTQAAHFGAFGAASWREWDFLMGRLHGAAHLARLLGGDDADVARLQRLVLASEQRTEATVDRQVLELQAAFPAGDTAAALKALRADLARSGPGQAVLHDSARRLIEISGGVHPTLGALVRAVAAETDQPRTTAPLRLLRWLTQPARTMLWWQLGRRADDPSSGPQGTAQAARRVVGLAAAAAAAARPPVPGSGRPCRRSWAASWSPSRPSPWPRGWSWDASAAASPGRPRASWLPRATDVEAVPADRTRRAWRPAPVPPENDFLDPRSACRGTARWARSRASCCTTPRPPPAPRATTRPCASSPGGTAR